ncbi:MAG TPA: SEC-C domain-containing protein [Clostridiaceae bacterium]|jgi:hypothetical protein|nr:SEC-C domain-containing protein [Clostridiaceae bacterium]
MSYYQDWTIKSENVENEQLYRAYVQRYYDLEKAAYDKILSEYPNNKELLVGTAKEMADKFGFPYSEMEVFVGFLDGIKNSLNNTLVVDEIVDDTPIELDIDYKKLYLNMLDAKADWLYKLSSWNQVFDQETMDSLKQEFRQSNMAHSDKVGRNDPCPCGSGKKYKKCCINK